MDIKNLENSIAGEVRTDAFNNPIKVGDAIYFTSKQRYGMNLGIISKFCPSIIKVNNGQYEFSVFNRDIVKVNGDVNKNIINSIKKKISKANDEKLKSKNIVTRYVWFIYKNKVNEEKGIGWWMISDVKKNHKSIITNNIKKMNENGYDIWFAHYNKTSDSIYFDNEPNMMPKENCMFTKSYKPDLTHIENMENGDKNEIRLFKYINDQETKDKVAEKMETLAKAYDNSITNKDVFYWSSKDCYLKYDSDFLFEVIPPKHGKIVNPTYEGVGGDPLMINEKMILLNALKDNYRSKNHFNSSFMTFKDYALNYIDLKIEETDEKINDFFNMIKNEMKAI